MTTAFVFPGQGSQYIGMGKISNAAIADKFFSDAESATSLPIRKLCLEGPEDELKKTEITQPAIFTISAIILESLKQKGILPQMAAGHSLGEYGALYAAGSINFSDAVKLLNLRGKFMQEAVPIGEGAMAAVLGLSPDIISEICKTTGVAAANYNSPDQTVISGKADLIANASKILKEKGAKRVIPLQVSAPFHSPLMKPAAVKLAEVINKIKFNKPNFAVYSNVTASPITSAEDAKKLLIEQVTASVRWVESIKNMEKDGADSFIEVGPGKVLTGLIKKIDPNAKITSGEEEIK